MASDTPANADSMSGITPTEAQAFHKFFQLNLIIFVGIASLAHLMMWIWRPWIPGEAGWAPVESAAAAIAPFASFLA
ncbi:MAG: light-harvesting protein [Pseudomonadota bacterium]